MELTLKKYTVKSGDGWYRIAKKNNVDVNKLLKTNNATLDTMIHPNQILLIPEKDNRFQNSNPDSKSKITKPKFVEEYEYRGTNNPYGTYIAWAPSIKDGEKCNTEHCARYANEALRNHKDKLGRRVYKNAAVGGHAWTRFGSNDIRIIYSGYDSEDYDKNNYSNYKSDQRNLKAADKLFKEFDSKSLNKNKVYIVNMFYKGSREKRNAWENSIRGTTGTHTGNLYFDNNSKRWKVSHNINGTIHNDDFIKILGSKGKYGVTAIAEVKAHDYTDIDAFKYELEQRIKKQNDYRRRKPIRGWIRDKLGMWQNGGRLIPKALHGLPITNDYIIKENGDFDYNVANKDGYDLRPIGIYRTYNSQKTYGNSDSLPIAHSLMYIHNRFPELINRYNLTYDEGRALLGATLAVLWNESGGASSKKVNPRTGRVVENYMYNKQDNNPLYMTAVRTINNIIRRGTSEGYGRVKVEDLRNLPNYSLKTENELYNLPKRTPHFSGLSTFASIAQRYNKLKDIFKDDLKLIFGEDATLNDLGYALLFTSHNLGFDNIIKNYNKYKKSGNLEELNQYKKFRYPRLSLLLIHGHNVAGSKPVQLDEVIVTLKKEK